MKLTFDPYCATCESCHPPGKHKGRSKPKATHQGARKSVTGRSRKPLQAPPAGSVADPENGRPDVQPPATSPQGDDRSNVTGRRDQAGRVAAAKPQKPSYEELLAAQERRRGQVKEAVRRYRARKKGK